MRLMDIRKVVRDRMEELGMNALTLAKKSKVPQATVYDFVRNPKDFQEYSDGRKRSGNMNSEALGQIFKALDLTLVPKK